MSKNSNNMKVLFLPDFSRNNPYLNNLRKGLRIAGIDIEFADISLKKSLKSPISCLGDFDIMHIHWTHTIFFGANIPKSLIRYKSVFNDLKSLQKKGKSVVWTVHNIWYHENRWRWLEKKAKRRLANLANMIIVHCEKAKDLIIDAYGLDKSIVKKIRVIPHGNYIENYPNDISRNDARAKLSISSDAFVFVNPGRICRYKGIVKLAQTFHKLENENAVLIIAGKAHDESIIDEINSINDTRIRIFNQFIPDEDMQIYLNAADFVVLPYDKILTSGNAALAMTFKKPIIAPRIGCIPEQIKSSGILYDKNDTYALSNAMRKAVNCDIDNMFKTARSTIESLSIEEIGIRLSSAYSELI